MAYKVSSLDELGDGYGFRKIRAALGVTAFGVNALLFPPGYDGPEHYHDTQDELYFVHRGTATFTIHGEATTPRRVTNSGDDDLVLFIVGGKEGYVERDGRVTSDAELEKRQRIGRGDVR